MKSTRCVLLSCCLITPPCFGFQSTFGITRKSLLKVSNHAVRPSTILNQALSNDDYLMTSSSRQKRDQSSSLQAFTVDQFDQELSPIETDTFGPFNADEFQSVLTSALMVTGNTIGAGALVVPELVAKPGMAISTGLFGAAYIVNLISGLILAEVAIKQHESAGTDVPISFKDLADENLDSTSASTVIAGISIFTNACVLAFDLHRAGDVADTLLGGAVGTGVSMLGFSAGLVALVSTQTGDNISKAASMMVVALFVSFFGLLVPGLGNVQDPIGTLFAPGTVGMASITEVAPIILMTLIYQNIVPTVTKILDYDRVRTTAAIALGSFLPLCLYLAWCFACIGGGIDLHSVANGANGVLMTVFSLTAITGSSLGCSMSLSEEVSTLVTNDDADGNSDDHSNILDVPSVALAVGVPMMAAHLFAGGQDFTAALKIAGSYGSPLLYFCVPSIMAWTQREKSQELPNLVPGGVGTLVGLGVASIGLMGQELIADVGSFIATN